MKKDIDYFRKKIAAMDYTPLTDEELAEVLEKDKKAVANAAIEGSHATPEENEFFAMLHSEMRLPIKLCKPIVHEWAAYRALGEASTDILVKQDVDIEKIRQLQSGTKDNLVFGSQWVINQAGDTYLSKVSVARDQDDQGDLYAFYSKGQSVVFNLDIKDISDDVYYYQIVSNLTPKGKQFIHENKSKIEQYLSYLKNHHHDDSHLKNINAKII